MARISFGSLLKNPLVLGVLATEMTSNLARSYTEAQNQSRAEEADQANKLKVIGETGGAMPGGTERGMFGKLAAKTGLVPELAPLTPYEQSSYQLGQQERQATVTQQGLEQRKVDIEQERADAEKLKAEREGGVSHTIFGPGGQTKSVSTPKGADYSPPEGWSLKAPFKPDKSASQIESDSAARTRGGITGKLDSDIASSPNPYYDPSTGNPVKKSMSIREARLAGYIPASPKAVQSYQDAKTVTSELDRLDAIAQRRLPSTKGMSKDQAAIAIGKSWIDLTGRTKVLNLDNEATDLVYASQLPAIDLIHQIQQRYPSTIELSKIEPLIPGKADSRESFHDKVTHLKSLLSHGISQGARGDAGEIIKSEGEAAATSWIDGDD